MRLVLSVRLAWLSTLPLIYASYFATQIRPSFSLLFYSVDSYVKGDLNRATVMMLMFVVPLLSLTRSPSFSNPSPLLGFESKEQVEDCWVVRITNPPVSFFNCSMSNGQSITLCWPASKISRMVTSDWLIEFKIVNKNKTYKIKKIIIWLDNVPIISTIIKNSLSFLFLIFFFVFFFKFKIHNC